MQAKTTVELSPHENVPRAVDEEEVQRAVEKRGLCRSEMFHITSNIRKVSQA